MKAYKTYLAQRGHSNRTIETNLYYIEKLKQWCGAKHISARYLNYRDLLGYIKDIKKNNQPGTVNNHLWAIKHYYTYLVEEGVCPDNAAEDLRVKGARKKVLHNLLTADELEDLYYSYETEKVDRDNFYYKATAKRNKVITGLMVYQGLLSNNLKRLTTENTDLYKGRIYIASTRRNAARTLELKPWQVMELMEYIREVRPVIQKHIGVYDERLFPLNTPQFNVILVEILRKLKTYNAKVTHNSHIRASVIVNWLGQYNIRKVQQMAGHRHISSTEAFKQNHLESLQEAVKNFHPIQ